MTVLSDVEKLISRLAPSPICDDCIAEKLQLPVHQHAHQTTRELVGGGLFERRKDCCSICGETKLVIRRSPGRTA